MQPPRTEAAVRFSPWLRGARNPGASLRIASCSGESGRLKSGRARIVTGVIHFSSSSLVAGHVPWEHDGCWFDSSLLDCDVRELANPVHCECIFDGIETRTSPKLLPAARARCLLSRSEARSTRAKSALPRESAGVDTRLSSGGEGFDFPTRRHGSERRSRNGFQIRLRRFESFQARYGVRRRRLLFCLASRTTGSVTQ